jgi:hypothetical protein
VYADPGPYWPRNVTALEVPDPGDLPDRTFEVELIAHLRRAPEGDSRDTRLVAAIEDDGNRKLPQTAP